MRQPPAGMALWSKRNRRLRIDSPCHGEEMHRLSTVLAAIDAANAADPVAGRALTYGKRMSARLARYEPRASEALQIAARAQHIERWAIPRDSYPMDRIGYLKWRKDLQHHHAKRASDLMAAAGYGESEIARVAALLRKEALKSNEETQILEDVICLVFLEHEAPDFIAKHGDAKVMDILAKTAKKMSPRGVQAIAKLPLVPRLKGLLAALPSEALNPER
jgi:Domain of unknown function (DUF4202)